MSTKREAMLEYLTCRREDPEYRDMIFTGLNPRTVKLDAQICERPNFFSGYDAFGVHWTKAIPASHRTPDQEPVLKDMEDWPDLKVPDVDQFCWDGLKEVADQARAEDKLVSVTLLMGAFERASVLMDFEDCLVAALTEPEEFSGLIGKICDYKIAQVERICRAAHPDVVNLHDDWGTGISTFLRPELWREVIRPHTQRLYDVIHKEGALVCQHSCGQITALVPDVIEMGADMWEAQLECFNLKKLKETCAGKLRILSRHWEAAEWGETPPIPVRIPDDLDHLPLCEYPYEAPPAFLR